MTTIALEILNRQLTKDGRNTVEEFCRRVSEVITRHDVHSSLPEQLHHWQEDNYDAAFLTNHIRPTLISLRRALTQKQFRCDGDLDQLQAMYEAFTSGQAAKHILDTIYVRVFVEWCDEFPQLAREE